MIQERRGGEGREREGELNRRTVVADFVQSEVRNSSCSGGSSNGCHGNEVVVVTVGQVLIARFN